MERQHLSKLAYKLMTSRYLVNEYHPTNHLGWVNKFSFLVLTLITYDGEQ